MTKLYKLAAMIKENKFPMIYYMMRVRKKKKMRKQGATKTLIVRVANQGHKMLGNVKYTFGENFKMGYYNKNGELETKKQLHENSMCMYILNGPVTLEQIEKIKHTCNILALKMTIKSEVKWSDRK